MTKRLISSILMFFISHFCFASMHSIDEPLDGPKSRYTDAIVSMIKKWSPERFLKKGSEPLKTPLNLRCFETPNNEWYIGLEQIMSIDAPISQVENILDDVGHYPDWIPDTKDSKIIRKDENKFYTFWEQVIHLPLVPNEKVEMVYLVDNSKPSRRIYRYQVTKAKYLKWSDGFILLEEAGPKETKYYEIDFFDADWGLAKALGLKKIWKDSVKDYWISDVAIKVKAEKPELSFKKVRDQIDEMLDQIKPDPIEQCVSHKEKFSLE